MTFAEAVTHLVQTSRLSRDIVERDPTYAAEVAAARAIECRDVIRGEAARRRDGLA
jgi:hypothetical protein